MALCRRYAGWNWLRSNHWQPIRDGRAVFGRSALLLLHDNVFHRFHSGRCRRRHLGGNLVLVVEALGLLVPALERLAGPLRDLVLLVHLLGAVESRRTRSHCPLCHFVLLVELLRLPTRCYNNPPRRSCSVSDLSFLCCSIGAASTTNDSQHKSTDGVANTTSGPSCSPHGGIFGDLLLLLLLVTIEVLYSRRWHLVVDEVVDLFV
mmetsp:Transcript_14471/g.28906  ORF Transcript_14471/g.28906 Transcript_14471/m.28906 type:complete len:206 (-) Transcript_14471:177-794(-)